MKILYVPLDERPCNYDFPMFITESNEDVDLLLPKIDLLGNKKKSANVDELWTFVFKELVNVDAVVLSMDMLLFGGLIPSRIHHLSHEDVNSYINNIKKLKEINPNVKVYASQCIMRCPTYNSSEEEPDYYAEYGNAIYLKKMLEDKSERGILSQDEIEIKNTIKIPNKILEDYENRRNFNLFYNEKVVDLVDEGFIDFMVIPQDDSSPYGYTAIAQKQIIKHLSSKKLESRINIYPGADEVGCSLVTRCYQDFLQKYNKVFVVYASVDGKHITPLYEDRPIHESLKYHLDVTKSYMVNTPQEADYILAINTPGKVMQEAFDQNKRDITYTSHRNLLYFVRDIERYINEGYKVAVCDSAYSNGGDLQLISFLDERNILDKLLAYAGWNTNCNTLGTVLSMSSFNLYLNSNQYKNHLVYRYLEDVFYQSIVRQTVIEEFLPLNGLSYYDFKDKYNLVTQEIEKLLKNEYATFNISQVYPIDKLEVRMPWKRMFELGMVLGVR